MTSQTPVPLARRSAATAPFWEGVRNGQLLLQRSRKTGRFIYYPREVSPFGADDELDWVEASGRGQVFAFSIARSATAPHMADRVPYVIAIVETVEGARMTANIIGCDPDQVRIGMPVEAVFVDAGDGNRLVQFRPDSRP